MTTPLDWPSAYPYARLAYRSEPAEGSIYIDDRATNIHVWPHEWVDGADACIVGVAGSVSLWDWGANMIATTTSYGYHRGYAIGVEHAWPKLLAVLEAHVPDGRPIHYRGHSRGGGQAFGFAALTSRWPVGSVITFGAPGVYTKDGLAKYPHHNVTLNVVNSIDVVPRLAFYLRRPGTDVRGPGKMHRIKNYEPKPEKETP